MNKFRQYQRVMDMYTGRIGSVVKVMIQENQFVYRVKFIGYTEDFHEDELKEHKHS